MEWRNYCKLGEKPLDIPAKPYRTYKDEWKGWGDWLGTGAIATNERIYLPYTDARQFVHTLNLKSADDWFEYCKSEKKNMNIPTAPYQVYKNEWKGWWDWLGNDELRWSVNKVKDLLRDLIKSRIIYEWDEAVLYSLLLRKGLLNIEGSRHSRFFKNLIEAGRTEEGSKIIQEYANSDSQIPPNLSTLTSISE